MSKIDDAIAVAAAGWPVFPCEGKQPRTARGFKEASRQQRRLRAWWRAWPDANVGVALPHGTMAVDVDDRVEFAASGLDLPDAPEQRTPSGGLHRLYATDGGDLPQTVKRHPGVDTRVGGKGYVVAWDASAFAMAPGDLPPAPAWVYDRAQPPASAIRPAQQLRIAVGSRDDTLASIAGTMRRAGLGPDAIYAAFNEMLKGGQIEQPREATGRITDADLRRIAKSIGTRDSAAVEQASRPVPRGQNANDLLAADLPDLEYLVDEILPEGLGVVAGAPKVGKSWLMLQAGVEVATGGILLDRPCRQRDVLYYGLEDGERRFQKRLRTLVGVRRLDLARMELRYEAPRVGDGLEDDISAWLDAHSGGLVVVDVLAKVRPVSNGKRNAYDEDYSVIGPLQTMSKRHPGAAVVVVTHDRKAGSEDFLTTVTGTRGVTGAADWVWVVKRPRLEPFGVVYVTGRDIEHDAAVSARFDGAWQPDQSRPLPGASSLRNDIAVWIRKRREPAWPSEVAKGMGQERSKIAHAMSAMVEAGDLMKSRAGYHIPLTPLTHSLTPLTALTESDTSER